GAAHGRGTADRGDRADAGGGGRRASRRAGLRRAGGAPRPRWPRPGGDRREGRRRIGLRRGLSGLSPGADAPSHLRDISARLPPPEAQTARFSKNPLVRHGASCIKDLVTGWWFSLPAAPRPEISRSAIAPGTVATQADRAGGRTALGSDRQEHMRSSKSRSRSKSNRQRPLGNVGNRVFDSSGPEGKARGTPQQIIDKYLMLARDAQLSNDRVAEQNLLQHAEHYARMLGEAQREMSREHEMRQGQQG